MPVRYVAFLRAINVGGHTVKMDALRRHFEDMGAANVETFIASGNVIFDSADAADRLERRLEAGLEKALKFPVGTLRAYGLRGRCDCGIVGVFRSRHNRWCVVRRVSEGCSREGTSGGGRGLEHAGAPLCRSRSRDLLAASEPRRRIRRAQTGQGAGPTMFRNITTVRKIAARLGGAAAGNRD